METQNLSSSTDTQFLCKALEMIQQEDSGTLDLKDAGTPIRFLMAVLSILPKKKFMLTGSDRMKERPIHDLVDALRQLGAQITYTEQSEKLPVLIEGKSLSGGQVSLRADISSQFISALCLIGPLLTNGMLLKLEGPLVSKTYIEMTLGLMKEAGVDVLFEKHQIHISKQDYQTKKICIESDWSSATFFYAMAMVSDVFEIDLIGLTENSLQGDSYMVELATDFGIETTFHELGCHINRIKPIQFDFEKQYDLRDYPDLAVPFILACALRYPLVTITGLYHLEFKESKRITVLKEGLSKVGIDLFYEEDILRVEYRKGFVSDGLIMVETFQDHRIAMSMTLLCLRNYTVVLDDWTCVAKSFPEYFEVLKKIGFSLATM